MTWTSGEIITASRLEDKNDKNIGNGYVGLNVSGYIPPTVFTPCSEKYYTHDCNYISGFMKVVTDSYGQYSTNLTSHTIMLVATTNGGNSIYQSKKYWVPSSHPIILTAQVCGMVSGDSLILVNSFRMIGFNDNFGYAVPNVPTRVAEFIEDANTGWYTYTANNASRTSTEIPEIHNNDIISIYLETSKAIFSVNGTVVSTHTTNMPTSSVYTGAAIYDTSIDPDPPVRMSIDMFNLERY